MFELWREHGEVLPFKVRRLGWSYRSYVVVESIEVKKWPYGKAEGYFVRDGQRASYPGCLSCAGFYQWLYVGPGN